jgi:hypothetical protein
MEQISKAEISGSQIFEYEDDCFWDIVPCSLLPPLSRHRPEGGGSK